MSAREKAAEVLAAHRIEGVGPGGECWCACGMGDEGHGTLWNAEGHRAHVVDALAEAGLLLDKGVLLDVLSKSKARAEKAEREHDEARADAQRLTHLLGSHADGHRCTCTMTRPGSHIEPPEWEQDPWCLTHPDAGYITAEYAKAREALARVEALADKWNRTALTLWDTHNQACDAGDTETADLIGAEGDAVEEQVRQLRAALRGDDA